MLVHQRVPSVLQSPSLAEDMWYQEMPHYYHHNALQIVMKPSEMLEHEDLNEKHMHQNHYYHHTVMAFWDKFWLVFTITYVTYVWVVEWGWASISINQPWRKQNIYDVHDYSKTGWPMLIRHPFDVRMATQWPRIMRLSMSFACHPIGWHHTRPLN